MSNALTLPECSPSSFDLPLMAELAKEDRWRSTFDCMMPCVVISKDYDRKNHRVEVQPLVYYHDSNGYTKRAPINCTVWRPFFHNYVIDMPIKQGDTGWVLSSDRGTDIVKQNCRPKAIGSTGYCDCQVSDSSDTHQYRWGIFIPDRWGDYGDGGVGDKLDTDDDDNNRLVIQSADATQRISIGHCDIKIFATNTTINTTSDTTINANAGVNINAKADVNLTSKNGVVKVEAKTVQAKADSMTMDTSVFDVTGGGGFQGAASGTISAGSIAQVKDGLIVSIGTA